MRAAGVDVKTVLLIEDDEASQYIYTTMLEHAGYRIVQARTGPAAADLLERMHPDLVIMDIGLPGVSGFELTRSIRDNPSTRDVPVLVITVHVFPDDVKRAHESGCTGFMAKPVDPSVVLEQVQALIGPARVE
ncbi:MAG TPA: response regulator [Longimicrobiales bacterium]